MGFCALPLRIFRSQANHIVEITGNVYMGRRDHVIAREIKAMRALGLRVALDDFGTGFASLTHLLTVPFDISKSTRASSTAFRRETPEV